MKLLLFCICLLSTSALAEVCEDLSVKRSYVPKHAQFFKINYYENFKIIISGRPGSEDKVILKSRKALNCTTGLPVFNVPAERFIATSTTHLPVLSDLNKEKTLVGFQGTNYIYNQEFNKKNLKNIKFQLNPEELIALRPDVIMAYQGNIPPWKTVSQYRELKLPVILNWDLAERSPLARAEWSVFTAHFFEEELKAINLFTMIESEYFKIKAAAQKIQKRQVLIGELKGGRWSTPGGKSDLAMLIEDAGGELVLKNNAETTFTLSLEEVLKKTAKTHIWLPHNDWQTLKDVKSSSRYDHFLHLKIYNNTNRLNERGFNDYWERGLARPDLLIKDLFWVIHPEMNQKHTPIWYKLLR